MAKETVGYYQSNIRTSRDEDSVYAMTYANQQLFIDKLQQENQELKKQLEEKENQQKEFIEYLKNKEKEFDMMGDAINSGACLGILREYKEIIGDKDE